MADVSRQVAEAGRRAASDAAPWVTRLARLGYAAKGVVYLTIGLIAARTAMGKGGDVEGSRGALSTLLDQPMGKVLLGIVALGLAGFVLWRAVQAALDPEHKGDDAKGAGARAGYAFSGIIYAGLTLQAVRLLMGNGQGGGGSDWTATLLRQPFGRWMVALVGLCVAGYGAYQIYRGATGDLAKRMDFSGAGAELRERVVQLGRAGTCARGVVFVISGWLLVQAGLRYDASRADGLEGALESLRGQAYGPWLLGAVAIGLIAYGVFQLAKGRFRRIRPA